MKKHETVEELRQRNVKFLSKFQRNYKASLALRCKVYYDYLPCCLDKAILTSSLLLDSHEILTHDSLYNFMNYIKNLLEELPLHLPKKKKLLVIINSSFNAKEAKITDTDIRGYG